MTFKPDQTYLADLRLMISDGITHFNTCSTSSARAMLLEPDYELSNEEADRLRDHLNYMERAGVISIEFKSTDGQYSGVRLR